MRWRQSGGLGLRYIFTPEVDLGASVNAELGLEFGRRPLGTVIAATATRAGGAVLSLLLALALCRCPRAHRLDAARTTGCSWASGLTWCRSWRRRCFMLWRCSSVGGRSSASCRTFPFNARHRDRLTVAAMLLRWCSDSYGPWGRPICNRRQWQRQPLLALVHGSHAGTAAAGVRGPVPLLVYRISCSAAGLPRRCSAGCAGVTAFRQRRSVEAGPPRCCLLSAGSLPHSIAAAESARPPDSTDARDEVALVPE